MKKIHRLLYSCFLATLLSSCAIQKDLVQLDNNKLEIVYDHPDGQCINNDLLVSVLKKNNYKYTLKNDDIYIEEETASSKGVVKNINHDLKMALKGRDIPKGYIPFKYRKLNLGANRYETRPLDELDRKLLPTVAERNGFKTIVINDCVYVERELIEDQDLLSKAIEMLDYERGDGPNPYSFPYPHSLIPH